MFFYYKFKFNYLFNLLNIKNNKHKLPSLQKIKFYDWGFMAFVDISKVCSFKDIENNLDFIIQFFRAFNISLYNQQGYVIFDVVLKDFYDLNYFDMNLQDNFLCFGYDLKLEPVVVDMYKCPHVAIQGLSNCGKSIMVELALKSLKNSNIYLINCFENDFKSISALRINGEDNIINFLSTISNIYQRKITYIVIDEVNVLNKNKTIVKLIENLLSQARHFNIYLICIGQLLLKENCSYKQLFNTRISFRTIDKSAVTSFLNCFIDNIELSQREFYIYSDSILKGKTFLM